MHLQYFLFSASFLNYPWKNLPESNQIHGDSQGILEFHYNSHRSWLRETMNATVGIPR